MVLSEEFTGLADNYKVAFKMSESRVINEYRVLNIQTPCATFVIIGLFIHKNQKMITKAENLLSGRLERA